MFFKYPKDFTCIDYRPGSKAEYVWGESMLLARFLVDSLGRSSSHDCDQISFVLNGECEFDIGGETKHIKKGDALYIPAGVHHSITKIISKPIEIIDVWPVTGPKIPS